jgi:DNA recombination protein RmuC
MTLPNLLALLLVAVAAFAAGAVGTWLFARQGRADLEKSARSLHAQWTDAMAELSRSRQKVSDLQVEVARLDERSLAEKRTSEAMRASFPDTFKTLASQVLQEKSQEFAEQNQTSLSQMLQPLKIKLEDFQQLHLEQVKDSATLRAQITSLFDSTAKVSDEANNLASALRGSSKTQGDWGELILETILESAGLRAGQEYEAQESYAAENGGRSQPDVVIHLPGERHLIIDSKVSLTAYYAHCKAETDPARAAALSEHLRSVRAHIKGLAEKNYQTLYGLKSLDFVIMFMPIEPAFMLALSGDDKLWQQAWQKNLLLVSPSTLLFVLRTVAYLWRQEQQERNVEEIARRGAELYNKLAGFVESLTEVGDRLTQAQKSYEEAFSRLSTGRGNVIRQAEMLKALGIKPSKHLPQGLVEQAGQETLELDIEGPR